MIRSTLILISLLCVFLSALISPSWSEEILTEMSAEQAATTTQGTSVSGYEVGSLRLLPEMSVTGMYDDNIFATRNDTKSDTILHFLPSLDLRSKWTEHSFKLNLGADFARYDKHSSENFEDYWLTTDGRYDLSEALNLFGGVGYSREHEERGSPEDQNGIEPTVFQSRSARLGSAVKYGKLGFRFGGTYEDLEFDNVDTSIGLTINNNDRDRRLMDAGIRAGYTLSESIEPFAQYVYNDRKYDSQLDDNGYRRDSHGYGVSAGLKLNLKPALTAELYAGTLRQEYEDDRFSTLSEVDYGASITWQPSPEARISGALERTIEETTLAQASGYLETSYRINLAYNLSRSTSFHSHVQFSQDDYQGSPRNDKILNAGFGLQYDFTRNLFLGADYEFSHRNSNLNDSLDPDYADYYRHKFMVNIGARFYPVKDDPLQAFSTALKQLYKVNMPPRGFYLGSVVSYGAMATRASEVRLEGGSSQADFGGDGFSGGIFAGYGINIGRWVYGLELQAEESSLEWQHTKDKATSRTFSVKQNEGLGGSARIGYTMLDGSILYGRVGLIKTRFDTLYTINESVDSYSETQTLTGLRLGLGLDVPLSEQWFWRMESTYTNYESYNVAAVDFSEEFEPEENVLSFGLGWHFDAPEQKATRVIIEELGGPYAGVQVGFGAITSEVNGLHNDGGGSDPEPGPYAYQSDFAGQRYTPGVFIGYGRMFDRAYVGAELDAEVNAVEWFRKRETSGGGRNFSVEAKESYGASVRLGYQCRNGALAYLKAGIVTTKTITKYAKGQNRDNDIYRDKSLDGVRYAAGIETPLNRASFIRLEFSHTLYDDYDLVTAHTNSDQIDFDHRQTMVALGIGFRF